MAVALSTRTSVVGAELSFVVLAAGRGACIGVDLASGAFVVVRWPGVERTAPALHRFEVAAARVAVDADDVAADDPLHRRESVVVAGRPRVVGRVRRRVAERLLRPLLLPPREHPLGFATASVPYWMVPDDRPSVCLVQPSGPISLVRSSAPGVACRFEWRGVRQELPLGEGAGVGSVAPAMDRSGRAALSGAPLADLVGFMPRRLLVALSPPREGVCHKVVPALLP